MIRIKLKIKLLLLLSFFSANVIAQKNEKSTSSNIQHRKVIYQESKYAGWPANWGMWNWGNEILVSYTFANHSDTVKSHSYDKQSSYNQFSRSLDGGLTWTAEDAFDAGIRQKTFEHTKGVEIDNKVLKKSIDFKNPGFALAFRMKDEFNLGSSMYYTYDKGKTWAGPYKITVKGKEEMFWGTVTRTDYIVDGKHEMTAFFTVGFGKGDAEGKGTWRNVACVRTKDGGKTWKLVSWVGEKMIMPASVRLNKDELITIIRTAKPAELLSFYSKNNGKSWAKRDNPTKVDMNGHPAAVVKLNDGTLIAFYALRFKKTIPSTGNGMYAIYSKDQGKNWSTPLQVRGGDGANWDIGYPRAIIRPDGKIVLTYYYNHAEAGDKYRYIAASIIDPQIFK